uniref:Uncharacterized protein n=1 Tax=Cannabis sativa TaxID=3483 RepID=A0A803R208_CANSA
MNLLPGMFTLLKNKVLFCCYHFIRKERKIKYRKKFISYSYTLICSLRPRRNDYYIIRDRRSDFENSL